MILAAPQSLIADLKIPSHIAVIMDGNARWAKKNNLSISAGHKEGSKAIKKLVKSAIKFGVKYLTIYAFSTENWQRPNSEVSGLMSLMKDYLKKDVNDLIKNDVRILISGDLQNLEKSTSSKINKIVEKTKNNKAITLNVAFDYGARNEILKALKKILIDCKNNKISFDDLSEDLISQNLYQPDIPDPDILIRTSGEQRVSNFLLWQIAYSELYFTQTLWPDFGENDLLLAIQEFNQRKRNYGKR